MYTPIVPFKPRYDLILREIRAVFVENSSEYRKPKYFDFCLNVKAFWMKGQRER